MSTQTTLLVLGGGALLAVLVVAWLVRARRRERALVEILDLPYGERDVSIEAATERGLVAGTVSLAGRMVDHVDTGGSLKAQLEEAHIPMRPGEFVIVSLATGLALGAVLTGVTGQWIFGVIGLVLGPIGGMAFLPAFDAQYARLPYIEISKQEYERRAAEFPEIDFSKIWRYESTDLTTAAQELACLAGQCEVDG
jgi:hypothetical protein